MDSIKKGAKKGINEWAKEVKHNKEFAEKFKGVKTVKGILRIAHEYGYSFTAKELENCDLNKVAGGAELGGGGVGYNTDVDADFDFDIEQIKVIGTSTGKNSKTQVNPHITVNKK